MGKEEREKREALEKEMEGSADKLAKLQSERDAAVRERDDLVEQVINSASSGFQ
jgi:hypothetical protein